ncbi:MAG: hypothetical protein DSO01_06640 [Archaeoglobi archaeon]|nr:MAG: hypothetical protein DSO01_06640 [Archaeoglobi archaeon]
MKIKLKFFIAKCPYCGALEIWQEYEPGAQFSHPDWDYERDKLAPCFHIKHDTMNFKKMRARFYSSKTIGKSKQVLIKIKEVEVEI